MYCQNRYHDVRGVCYVVCEHLQKWLDAIILVATLGAAYVVFAGIDTFDKYLA